MCSAYILKRADLDVRRWNGSGCLRWQAAENFVDVDVAGALSADAEEPRLGQWQAVVFTTDAEQARRRRAGVSSESADGSIALGEVAAAVVADVGGRVANFKESAKDVLMVAAGEDRAGAVEAHGEARLQDLHSSRQRRTVGRLLEHM